MQLEEVYLENFKSVEKSFGVDNGLMPADLVFRWNEFVEQCEEGYQYSLYDYDYDLTIRDNIERFISSSVLQSYDDHNRFAEQINLIDERFRSVLSKVNEIPGAYWWNKGVLKYARDQYVENVKAVWSIIVEVV